MSAPARTKLTCAIGEENPQQIERTTSAAAIEIATSKHLHDDLAIRPAPEIALEG